MYGGRTKMEIRQVSQNIRNLPLREETAFPKLESNHKKELVVQRNAASEKEITPEQIKEMVSGANQFFKITRTHLQFHLHEDLNRHYVEIRNTETNEVIKEVPSKKFLDMVAKLLELAGLLIDEKV
jgi:flagellar protein FlaG